MMVNNDQSYMNGGLMETNQNGGLMEYPTIILDIR